MAHNHDNCTNPTGAVCTSGVVSDYCDFETCDNEYCSELGHCECLCHSGKTCGCGHQWPRMVKGVPAAEEDADVTAPVVRQGEVPVKAPTGDSRVWATAIGDQVEAQMRARWPRPTSI
jgi:hypothetical protein